MTLSRVAFLFVSFYIYSDARSSSRGRSRYVDAGASEQRLLNHLLKNYDTDARGVVDPNSTVTVSIAFLLLRIQSLVGAGHDWCRAEQDLMYGRMG